MTYSNYSTYLRYKNCCRPIGDTGPVGPTGPTGPPGPDISGNKGEIIYFSENDNLVSTDALFITNGNVTINNDVNIIGNLDICGNISLNKNSITDVDAIYFSENGSSNQIFIDYAFDQFIMKSQGSIRFKSEDINTSVISDIKITIDNNNELRFNNDNTYITANTSDDKLRLYGNSIFMEAGVNGDFNFFGNSTNVDLNFLTQSIGDGYTINYKGIDKKIRLNNNDFVIDTSNNYIGIQTDSPSATLEVNGNAIINGNLSMSHNFINDVSGIYFTQGNMLFSDFSSVNQNVQLPSSQGQPISLERKTLFYDPSFNITPGGIPVDISFVVPSFNQLGLTISGTGNTIIRPSLDISGQYVELYTNFLINATTSASKTIALDISGVTSGSSFFETIDVRTISKQGSYYITFGPHIFAPEQWTDTSEFVITLNSSANSFTIQQYKLMFKSYFM